MGLDGNQGEREREREKAELSCLQLIFDILSMSLTCHCITLNKLIVTYTCRTDTLHATDALHADPLHST